MQSQSQNGAQAQTADEAAVSRKVAPANDPHACGNADSQAGGSGAPVGTSSGTPEDSPRERQARIAAEAYRIAEERGFPANSAVDHWYEAQCRLGYAGLNLADANLGSSSERM